MTREEAIIDKHRRIAQAICDGAVAIADALAQAPNAEAGVWLAMVEGTKMDARIYAIRCERLVYDGAPVARLIGTGITLRAGETVISRTPIR